MLVLYNGKLYCLRVCLSIGIFSRKALPQGRLIAKANAADNLTETQASNADVTGNMTCNYRHFTSL